MPRKTRSSKREQGTLQRRPRCSLFCATETKAKATAPKHAKAPTKGRVTRASTGGRLDAPAASSHIPRGRRCRTCGEAMKGHGPKCSNGMSKAEALQRALEHAADSAERLDKAAEELEELRIASAASEGDEAESAATAIDQDTALVGGKELTPTQNGADDAGKDAMNVDAAKGEETSTAVADDEDDEDATSKYYYKTPIANGFKSTPEGDLNLTLERNGDAKLPYMDQKMRTKHTPRLFQATVQKADILVHRVDGWALVLFVPKDGRGEMRSWSSNQVVADTPNLSAEVRSLVFKHLDPLRAQVLQEKIRSEEKQRKKLRKLQKQNKEMEEKCTLLEAEMQKLKNSNV
ncbi:hypothetical protein EXIGLDRAFT_694394 [Exidia glandulosa HHB12029]|uniref:Uncharacterized protein n=1 Tax=Exidia glandulosa HHB12029 TaxID=1314781 RepID=A0A165GMT4_EXIGL|nr:hypothetical protein EXIGLDRAFT_694394 [Exidia glandulosa HHB12029]